MHVRPKLVALGLFLLFLTKTLAQIAKRDLRVRIPNYIGLRIVDGFGTIARGPTVLFDYESHPDAYVAAAQGDGRLAPTAVVDFPDVLVSTPSGAWRVWINASQLTQTRDHPGNGLQLIEIRVERDSVSGLTPDAITNRPDGSILADWSPSSNSPRLVRANQSTSERRGLRLNGVNYVLTVRGDEVPGRYTTVVTYLLTNP